MSKKETMDLLLSKVEESQKEAFIQALRDAKTKEERSAVFKKHGITLTPEEKEALQSRKSSAVSDEELDEAAGGCSSHCNCICSCG